MLNRYGEHSRKSAAQAEEAREPQGDGHTVQAHFTIEAFRRRPYDAPTEVAWRPFSWSPAFSGPLSPRLGLGLLVAGLWALFSVQAPRGHSVEHRMKAPLRAVGHIGVAAFLPWTLSVEAWLRYNGLSARHLALSLLWAFYSARSGCSV